MLFNQTQSHTSSQGIKRYLLHSSTLLFHLFDFLYITLFSFFRYSSLRYWLQAQLTRARETYLKPGYTLSFYLYLFLLSLHVMWAYVVPKVTHNKRRLALYLYLSHSLSISLTLFPYHSLYLSRSLSSLFLCNLYGRRRLPEIRPQMLPVLRLASCSFSPFIDHARKS